VTSETVEPFLEGQTLEEALQNKKIYIVDHSFLKYIQCTDNRKVWLHPKNISHLYTDIEYIRQ
jgi:hypothetical protein